MNHPPELQAIWAKLEKGAAAQAEAMCREKLNGCTDKELRREVENLLGYALVALQQFEEARELYKRLFVDSGDHRYLHQLAMVEREAGAYERALEYVKQEATLIPADDALALAANLYEASLISYFLSQVPQAHTYAESCLQQALCCDDQVMRGCAWRLSGELAKAESQIARARECFQNAIEAFEAGDDGIAAAEIRLHLSNL